MFSINEIWHVIQNRLIDLKVMKDPDEESLGSASESTEFEDDFDFCMKAGERVGHLFRAKDAKDHD